MQKVRCNNCGWVGVEDDLKVLEDREFCPKCDIDSEGKIMDVE